jgi:homoserine kinase
LGLALDLRKELTAEIADAPGPVRLEDAAVPGLNPDDNLLCRAYRAWFAEDGKEPIGASFRGVTSRIPLERGFGSSAAAIVVGLAAAAAATGDKEPRDRLIRLATHIEGHPDNVVPAILGGVTTAFCDGQEVRALHVANHLTLGVALFVPDEPLSTAAARAVLPKRIALADAVYNVSRVAYLTTALIWGRWELIGPAMEDRLHQPYRAKLLPALDAVIIGARKAGAYGAALSGGGPSVIALGPKEQAEAFAQAMEQTAQTYGWSGSSIVTGISHRGVRVTEEGKDDE